MPLHIAPLENTPIGTLWLAERNGVLLAIHFHSTGAEFTAALARTTGETAVPNSAALEPIAQQLCEYFAGERREFDVPLAWDSLTAFQQRALRRVYAIPYGELATYQEIANQLGAPQSTRAVGRANATNPIPIIIPCHRVIGANGKLHGYGGGLEHKATLLRLEGSWLL